MADVVTNFGALLRSGRTAVGLTQEDLAGRSGLSVRAISNLERGLVTRPRRSSVIRLADGLCLSAAERARLLNARTLAVEDERTGSVVGESVAGEQSPPRQLPRQAPHFLGRAPELARLNALLLTAGSGPAVTSEIVVITGPAGVGKSALALRWAHQVAGRFPHGQLYIDLQGFSHDPPVAPAEALARFLRALGLEAPRIPDELTEAASLFRTMLSTRQILILLDNAASADQVRPLLPAGPDCRVVVTSRDRLAGLVAVDGAHSLTLDVLDPDSADEMLARAIGPRRAAGELEAVAELSARCGFLPLALRVAAASITHRPRLTLTEQAARLSLLHGDDGHAVLRAAFDTSYYRLEAATRRLFRRLGLAPDSQITAATAAALADEPLPRAAALLDRLCAVHLVECVGFGQYRLSRLLRQYAIDRVRSDDTPQARRLALRRLADAMA